MIPAIKVDNLSKQYRLGLVGTGTLVSDINRWWHVIRGKEDPYLSIGETNDRSTKGNSDYIWALKDINFEVQPGEVLGIIGKNGAGKSTLLKILSKVTAPTTGSIAYKGRIGSLLEVGTGFNPELTGRENIYLNGAILGMRKREIDQKLDEMIYFSGCLRYIDTPVKRYSSGMTVRLGFAVAAFLEPEILVVDEVLAVGDAEFQKKAIGKMQDVSRNDGRSVLFVSHNMASIKQLCHTGIILGNGKIIGKGNIHEIISQYLISNSPERPEWVRNSISSSEIYFNHIQILNSQGNLSHSIASEEDFSIILNYTSVRRIPNATISIRFTNAEGIPIFTTSLHDSPKENDECIEKGTYTINVNISKNILVPGKYNLLIASFITRVKLFDSVEDLTISVEDLGIKKKDLDREGFVIPTYKWEYISS